MATRPSVGVLMDGQGRTPERGAQTRLVHRRDDSERRKRERRQRERRLRAPQEDRRSNSPWSAWLRFALAAGIIFVALLLAFMMGWA